MTIFSENLIESIQNNTFKEVFLDLSGQEVDDGKAELLAEALKTNSYIKSIKLSHNNIGDKGVLEIASVSSLKEVNLMENQITSVGAQSLAKTTLQKLNISNNPIGDSGLEFFTNNTTLLELEASGCNITALGGANLFQNKALKKLDLSNNLLKDAAVEPLVNNTSLEELKLAYTAIGELGAIHISHNGHLRVLDLSNNYVQSKGSQALALHPTLEVLDLTENQVSDEGAKAFSETQRLRELILFGNAITTSGLSFLLKSPSLDFINLYDNPIYLTTLSDIEQSSFETSDHKTFTRKRKLVDQSVFSAEEKTSSQSPLMTPHFSVTQEPEPIGKRKAQELVVHPDFYNFFHTAHSNEIKNFFDSLKDSCIEFQRKKARHHPSDAPKNHP